MEEREAEYGAPSAGEFNASMDCCRSSVTLKQAMGLYVRRNRNILVSTRKGWKHFRNLKCDRGKRKYSVNELVHMYEDCGVPYVKNLRLLKPEDLPIANRAIENFL